MELVFTAFVIKHFLCDYPLQYPRHFLNKGIYGHRGGIEHAGIHGIGTLIVCLLFGMAWWLAIIDAVIHYHIDWSKNQLNEKYKLTPASRYFWWLIGADQLAHYMTYILLISAF